MGITKKIRSEKLTKVISDVSEAIAEKGQRIVFKYTREYPNSKLHGVRGIQSTLSDKPSILAIYLNKNLKDTELELVTVHELCHVIAAFRGFKYTYVLTHQLPESQLELLEELAISVSQCFTHLTVFKLTKEYGYDINGFDNCSLDDIRESINQGIWIGTASVAQNAILHISSVYQEKESLSTLNTEELERLYDIWDRRILELSRKTQPAIPDEDLFDVYECFEATIALRDAIGENLELDLASHMRLVNPETGIPE